MFIRRSVKRLFLCTKHHIELRCCLLAEHNWDEECDISFLGKVKHEPSKLITTGSLRANTLVALCEKVTLGSIDFFSTQSVSMQMAKTLQSDWWLTWTLWIPWTPEVSMWTFKACLHFKSKYLYSQFQYLFTLKCNIHLLEHFWYSLLLLCSYYFFKSCFKCNSVFLLL